MELDYPPVIHVVPWHKDFPGPGFPARSSYVELVWCSRLGPTATLAVRVIGQSLDATRDGHTTIALEQLAQLLGVGHRGGRHSPLCRALRRLEHFGIANHTNPEQLAVRTVFAPLPARQLRHTSDLVQAIHQRLLSGVNCDPVGPVIAEPNNERLR